MERDISVILGMAQDNRDYHYQNCEGPIITFSPLLSKNSSLLLRHNLVHLHNSVVVVDTGGGDLYKKTKDFRNRLGHRIVTIDPFGVTGDAGDTFNPLDVLQGAKGAINDNLRVFVTDFMATNPRNKYTEPGSDGEGQLYRDFAIDLVCGILLYLYAVPEKKFNLIQLRETLFGDDVVYNLAVVLDTLGRKIDPEAYQCIAAFLQRSDNVRQKTITTAQQYLTGFASKQTIESLSTTSFDLNAIQGSTPFSVYLILPPSKLEVFETLLRLWVSSLIQLTADADYGFDKKVLFLLDSASRTGDLPFYQNTALNSKNRNIQLWTFWESLGELQKKFPLDWETILGDCSLLQAFDIQKPVVSQALAPVLGMTVDELRKWPPDEDIVMYGSGLIIPMKKIPADHE